MQVYLSSQEPHDAETRQSPSSSKPIHTEQDIIADEENPPPSITEVTLAIKKLKNNRSTGPDSIPSELLKVDEPELVNALHKIMPYIDQVIGNYQCGFRPQRSNIDQIHTLRRILEKTKEYNIKTFHLFADFKAAYDSINRDKMIEAMTEFKIPKKLVDLTKATLKNVRCRIKIQKYLSEPLTTERGLRQGDSLACLLFNLVLEICIRDSGLDRNGTVWNRSLQLLAYADDIDIIGRSEKAVKEAFQALEISATNMGLTINEDKTKFMETLPSSVNNNPFCVNGHSFERVSEFKYLGTIINDQNKLEAEINNRIKSANKCFFGLKKQLRSKFISGKTKLYKEPQVTQVIQSNRLRWLEKIWRSPENNQTRAYTFKNPMGSRTRGRPPTRWIDDVENDLKTLNIKNWQRVAAYRWNLKKRAVEAAKTCNSCELQEKMEVNKEKIRFFLQFFFDKGENASQGAEIANGVYGADIVTANYVQFWFRRFRSGIFDFKDAPRTDRPVNETVDKIPEIIEVDRHVRIVVSPRS
ncbi:reverse transcriptase domain-containing protein [Trichonephila clavipes]|nr:reverse transcriptase domain-containing protein [Trichonephila clavipes]